MRIFALLLACAALHCSAAEKSKVVFIAGEYEYSSRETLPAFAADLARSKTFEPVILKRPEDEKLQTIPGLEALRDADLLVLFVRRMTLPEAELNEIRNYLNSGKPLVALRTASHAFENWPEFDKEILGGNYGRHYGAALKTTVTINGEASSHPILQGFTGFVSDGSLYKNTPLRPGTRVLLMGQVNGQPPEPVAWTRETNSSRVFYSSLGHPNDFKQESFRRLLTNAIDWALNKPLPKK